MGCRLPRTLLHKFALAASILLPLLLLALPSSVQAASGCTTLAGFGRSRPILGQSAAFLPPSSDFTQSRVREPASPIANIFVGADPTGVAVDPFTNMIYVANTA